MTVSVLLRLVPDTLMDGRVAGHAEVVDTGESVVFKDIQEMLAFLVRATAHGSRQNGGTDGIAIREDSSARG